MSDIELQIFADRLKELRNSLNLTQAEFVKDLGITASALSAYETNQKNPSISVAKRIAEKYNISIDWLCGLSDKQDTTKECTTYSDIIKMLLVIEKYMDITISCSPAPSFDGIVGTFGDISFKNSTMVDFLLEWEKIKELHDTNTIDSELYDLWIEKMLKKYEIKFIKKNQWDTPFENIDFPD